MPQLLGLSGSPLALVLLNCIASCTEISYESSGSGATAGESSGPNGGGAVGGGGNSGGAGAGAGAGAAGSTGGGGCSADLTTDPEHCGACFHDCAGGECLSGVCQPVELWASLLPQGKFSYGVTIAEAEVVWVCGEGTLSLPVDAVPGTVPFVVSTIPGIRIMYESPTLFRTWAGIVTSPLGGGGDTTTLVGPCDRDLTRDAIGNTYCADESGLEGLLYRFDANFAATPMLAGLPTVFGVAVDTQDVYVGTQIGLLRVPKNSINAVPDIMHGAPVASQLVRVGQQIYFGSDALLRLHLASGNVTTLVNDVSPGSIHVDSDHVYFSDWTSSNLARVGLDGENPHTWSVKPPYADVLAGNDEFLFFTSAGDGRLFRLRK